VRNRPTDLTQAIAQGMLNEAPGAELAIFNGGSVRIDDVAPPGNEQGLAFLNRDNAAVTVVGEHADIRFALIDQLKRQFGAN
jgi:hypothetical protein